MMRILRRAFALGLLILCGALRAASPAAPLVFATCVTDPVQEYKAGILVDSIRRFGGPQAQAPVYVATTDPDAMPCARAKALGAIVLPLEMDAAAQGWPLAEKVYAAAQVERLVIRHAGTMVWMDAESLLLGPPKALEMDRRSAVALRPVFLINKVGLRPEQPVDAFWSRIYDAAKVDPNTVPTLEACLDPQKLRFYINCEIISFKPGLGICQEWARIFSELMKDKTFLRSTCSDFPHQLFLHQAVLSGVILSRTRAEQRHWLPSGAGYAFHLHARYPESRKLRTLNEAEALIYENELESLPDWAQRVAMDEPLRSWFTEAQRGFYRITDRLFREELESECNSYLVLTDKGSVLIDPGGASQPGSFLLNMAKQTPLQAILLTHGHNDHRKGIALWKSGREIPVIAQREIVELLAYQDRLAGFFRERNAAHSGAPTAPPPDTPVATPLEATVLFADEYTYECGGMHFQFFHTGGETPDTSLLWVPELKAVFMGDDFYTSFPMLYTPRATKPRWALDYINALEKALSLDPECLLPGHGRPILGRDEVKRRLTEYRDAIRHVHDETVKGMNAGKDVYRLMEEITLPPGSKVKQSYGRVSWSVRGIYEGYAGWFDGDPAHLYAKPASSVYPDLVGLAGMGPLLAKVQEKMEAKDFLGALHLADVALAAQPAHPEARELRIKALKGLRSASRNGAEINWLNFAIQHEGPKIQNPASPP